MPYLLPSIFSVRVSNLAADPSFLFGKYGRYNCRSRYPEPESSIMLSSSMPPIALPVWIQHRKFFEFAEGHYFCISFVDVEKQRLHRCNQLRTFRLQKQFPHSWRRPSIIEPPIFCLASDAQTSSCPTCTPSAPDANAASMSSLMISGTLYLWTTATQFFARFTSSSNSMCFSLS